MSFTNEMTAVAVVSPPYTVGCTGTIMPQRRIAAKSPINDPENHRIRVESPLSLEDHTSDDDDSDNDTTRRMNDNNMNPHNNESLLSIDHDDHKVRLWKESPFAAGLTEPTWMDERKRTMSRTNSTAGRSSSRNGTGRESAASAPPQQQSPQRHTIPADETGCLWMSAFICPYLGASRVGNMVVLRSSQEKTEDVMIDPETGESTVRRFTRPKLDIVVGPYWPMMLCVTYPLIFGVSAWTLVAISSSQKPLLVLLVWFLCTITLIVALAFTACRDPGILYRTREAVNESWRWNDSADTYRPPGSWYDGDTAVVVEGFDHT
jgi:hypothetical protein